MRYFDELNLFRVSSLAPRQATRYEIAMRRAARFALVLTLVLPLPHALVAAAADDRVQVLLEVRYCDVWNDPHFSSPGRCSHPSAMTAGALLVDGPGVHLHRRLNRRGRIAIGLSSGVHYSLALEFSPLPCARSIGCFGDGGSLVDHDLYFNPGTHSARRVLRAYDRRPV